MNANVDQERIAALEAALQSMWAFATGLVAKHGTEGDESMTDADHAEWQEAGAQANRALGTAAPSNGKVTVYTGHLSHDGQRLQVDFQAPAGATCAELDSLFLATLAQQVELEYLAVGDSDAPIQERKGS
ncbi:MAG: hypothetical protein L6Q68_08990 [Aquabacterium sp.]|nr:hypothetical protein [Aquabacterium sp.]